MQTNDSPPDSADRLISLATKLGDADSVSTTMADRVSYAHDASPIALRQASRGDLPHLPMAVVWPRSTPDVQAIVKWAIETQTPLVPFGSGSGIVGGALPSRDAVVVDMKRMNRVTGIDPISMTVRAETGINGQILEDTLGQSGMTLGHLPQSIRASTLGGWIAHRAAGVASTRYGKIEDLVVSLEVVLPTGEVMTTRSVPRASTGPDLNQLFLGAEGAFGIVTAATLSIREKPEHRTWQAYAYSDMPTAIDAIRQVIQHDFSPAIVRLYDAIEARPLLHGVDVPDESVLLLWGPEGRTDQVAWELDAIRRYGAPTSLVDLGPGPGERWWSHRLSTSGLLKTLNLPTGIADALEITGSWSNLADIYAAMRQDMLAVAGANAQVFGHVSHVYRTGANLYMIFHAQAPSVAEVPALYDRILDAAFRACLDRGGSLSHHHGVGSTKARWLPDEHGDVGIRLIRSIQKTLDPAGIMNPGVGLSNREPRHAH